MSEVRDTGGKPVGCKEAESLGSPHTKTERMMNYIVTCESGVECLVLAESALSAEEEWDAEAERGNAEPRGPQRARKARRADVRYCVETGHDYR